MRDEKRTEWGQGSAIYPLGMAPAYLHGAGGCQEHKDGETQQAAFISAFQTTSPRLLQQAPLDLEAPNSFGKDLRSGRFWGWDVPSLCFLVSIAPRQCWQWKL